MERRIKFTSDPKEIQKHLTKLYTKIEMQVLLMEADISQKHLILSKQETDKLKKYNFDHNISGS